MIKCSKKERGTEMKSKKVPEEIIVDYVAKERAARTGGNSIMEERLAWLVIITYMSYACYSIITVLNEKQISDEDLFGLSLMLIFMCAIPTAFMYVMFATELITPKAEAARKNINILLNRYYKGNWQKIEDMLYEKRKVFSAESVELVSGNMSNENLKEAVPAK